MNEIQAFSIAHLRNEESFAFHDEVSKLALMYLNYEGDEEIVDTYKAAIDAFDEVLKLNRTNSFSDEVSKANQDSDNCWRGLRKQLKTMERFPDPVKSETAKSALKIVNNYGEITHMSQGEKYGNISNLLQDLQAISEADQKTIGIDLWISELSSASIRHMVSYRSFIEEEAEKRKGITQQRRDEADKAYKVLAKRVNAIETVNADGRHLPFIKNVNVLIDKEKTKLAARQTRAENKRSEEMEKLQPAEEGKE